MTIHCIVYSCVFSLILGNVYAKVEANYDESKVGEYTLPRLDAKDVAQWENTRRPEILHLFEENVYGKTPAVDLDLKFELTNVKEDALDGLARRKLIHVSLPKYPAWEGMDILLYSPKNASKAVPCFVGLNFGGNQGVTAEADIPITTRWIRDRKGRAENNRATEESRGASTDSWQVARIVKSGYALATVFYGDLEADHATILEGGIRAALSPEGLDTKWKSDDWGAIGAWAWGLSRIADYLETDPDIDTKYLASVGHSRLGKTSLWAGAQDPRFGIVISNNSGEGGAAIMRRNYGETTAIITRSFPHWFANRYADFGADPSTCPVDQHMLIALMAPRAVYIATASEDRWADTKGQFLSGVNAESAYAIYGKQGLGVDELPEIEHPLGKNIGFHIRKGEHAMAEYDWIQYIKFAKRHWGF